MKTGVTASKSRKRFQIVAASTGSAAIIALSVAFVAVDFNDLYISSAFQVDSSTIAALEPIRSDPVSEQDGSGDDGGGFGNDGNGTGNSQGDGDSDGNGNGTGNGAGDYPEHGEPCLDPNCPIHHGDRHVVPCDDPNCPICNGHGLPCNDPNCPIHNGHGLPCDDPNCPIHHGDDKPPIDIKTDDVIRFKPNSYEFVDEAAANAVLREFVDSFTTYFERYPDGKIYLVGGIAKTDNTRLTEIGNLSQQRADTVRQGLIDLGIDESRLIAIGVGINDPWRNDEWVNGYFDEEIAKTNRRVWVIPDQYEDQVVLILDTRAMIDDLRDSE